ncbi:MAG TPA: right-handed parallel beta-helix repeat-containing protein [Ktedonobacterales bacterium]|nr:right-handed parallel beta-helix repeat-containing protein [Ktedonobacterales bacterium]
MRLQHIQHVTTEQGHTQDRGPRSVAGRAPKVHWARRHHSWQLALAVLAALTLALAGAATSPLSVAHADGLALSVTDCSTFGGSGQTNTVGDALAQAQATTSGGATITFACAGTGPFTINVPATIEVSTTLTIRSAQRNVTLDGQQADGTRVRVFAVGGGGNLTLDGLTVIHGHVSGFGAGGAGVYNNGGSLTITNSTFSDNSASYGSAGGGVYSNGGSLTITNSTFSDNSASYRSVSSSGGGVYNLGGALTITNSAFTGNSAIWGSGGAVYNDGNDLTITNSTFTDNRGYWGGGIRNVEGSLTITNSAFSGNQTPRVGGAVYDDGTDLTIINSTFTGNSSGFYGGGGGAVFNLASTASITNSTLSGNSAGRFGVGGGVYNAANSGALTIANSIVVDNVSSADVTSANCGGTITDGGYNLTNTAGNTLSGGCPAFTADNHDVLTDSPGLAGSLADNGGPTQTIALQGDSPALDQIPNGVNSCGTEIQSDQRGISRPQGWACDIGAYELESLYTIKRLYPGTTQSTIPIRVQVLNKAGDNVSASTLTLTVAGVWNPATNEVSPLSGAFLFMANVPQGPLYQFKTASGYARGSYILLFNVSGDPVTYGAAFTIG